MNDDIELFLERVDSKYESGDTEGALADLDEAIRIDPSNAIYYRNRGRIKYGIDHHEEAIGDFNFFLEHISDIGEKEEIYRMRSVSYEHLHRHKEQLLDLTWLIDNGFDEDGYFFDWRCGSKRESGLFGEAVRDFSFAIDKRKSNKLLLGRAETYLKMGAYEDAFRDLAQIEGDMYENLLIKRAQLYYQMGGHKEAIEDFTQLIHINRSGGFRSAMYHWRGKCYYRLNQLEDALADFNQMQLLKEEKAFTDVNQYIEYLRLNDAYF